MAMTKKELAEVEALKTRLALRFFPKVEPDILPPTDWNEIRNGWRFNTHSKSVEKACTGANAHNDWGWDATRSQGATPLYSSRALAYKAMLYELSSQAASDLRSVERIMESLPEEK